MSSRSLGAKLKQPSRRKRPKSGSFLDRRLVPGTTVPRSFIRPLGYFADSATMKLSSINDKDQYRLATCKVRTLGDKLQSAAKSLDAQRGREEGIRLDMHCTAVHSPPQAVATPFSKVISISSVSGRFAQTIE